MFVTTAAIERLIEEDIPYIDLTSELLGIDQAPAEIRYITRMDGVVAGTEIVAKLCRHLDIELLSMKRSGTRIAAGDELLKARGSGANIHTLWKVGQNILDYSSGVAKMGVDIIQFDKLSVEALKEAVAELHIHYPDLHILAAGGINGSNIEQYCQTGVNGIVTTAPYYAKALDIKVEIECEASK